MSAYSLGSSIPRIALVLVMRNSHNLVFVVFFQGWVDCSRWLHLHTNYPTCLNRLLMMCNNCPQPLHNSTHQPYRVISQYYQLLHFSSFVWCHPHVHLSGTPLCHNMYSAYILNRHIVLHSVGSLTIKTTKRWTVSHHILIPQPHGPVLVVFLTCNYK